MAYHTATGTNQPSVVSGCHYLLGGTYEVKEKKLKLNAHHCVELFSFGGCTFYSAKTHPKGSICIVIVGGDKNLKQCLATKCKDACLLLRKCALYDNSVKLAHYDPYIFLTLCLPLVFWDFSIYNSLSRDFPCLPFQERLRRSVFKTI